MEKVFSLLSHQSAVVRSNAQRQIAELSSLSNCTSVLLKLTDFLISSKWHTRISAACATKNVLETCARSNHEVSLCPENVSNALSLEDFANATTCTTTNSNFIFRKTTSSSRQLLEVSVPNVSEQRERLMSRLGFDARTSIGVDGNQIISESDLTTVPMDGVVVDVFCNARSIEPRLVRIEVSDFPPTKKAKFEHENHPETSTLSAALLDLHRTMLVRLFDDDWTVRHGAVLATKTLYESLDDFQIDLRLTEDTVTRLLFLFLLDRFTDFASDQAVAPVRESAAQALAVVAQRLPADRLSKLLDLVSSMASDAADWNLPYAALITFKYLLVSADSVDYNRQRVWRRALDLSLRFLSDPEADDDVCGVATQCLSLLISDRFVKEVGSTDSDDIWQRVSQIVVSRIVSKRSFGSVSLLLVLLSKLLLHNEVVGQSKELVQIKSAGGLKASEMGTVLTSLLFQHDTASAVLSVLDALFTSDRAKFWISDFPSLLDRLYRFSLLGGGEQHCAHFPLVEKIWSLILECIQVTDSLGVSSVMFQRFPVWLSLAMQPAVIPFSSEVISNVTNCPDSHDSAESFHDVKIFIGGSGEKSDEAVFKIRRHLTKVLSLVVRILPETVSPDSEQNYLARSHVYESVSYYLGGKSSLNRIVALFLVFSWCSNTTSTNWILPRSVTDDLFRCCSETQLYDELAHSFCSLQDDAANFIDRIGQDNLEKFHFSRSTTPLSLDQIGLLTDLPLATDRLLDSQKLLGDNLAKLRLEIDSHNRRVQCLASACLLQSGALPEKLTPLIRPLMDSVRYEVVPDFQTITVSVLASLIGMCVDRRPSPNDKLIRNLVQIIVTNRSTVLKQAFESYGQDCDEKPVLNQNEGILSVSDSATLVALRDSVSATTAAAVLNAVVLRFATCDFESSHPEMFRLCFNKILSQSAGTEVDISSALMLLAELSLNFMVFEKDLQRVLISQLFLLMSSNQTTTRFLVSRIFLRIFSKSEVMLHECIPSILKILSRSLASAKSELSNLQGSVETLVSAVCSVEVEKMLLYLNEILPALLPCMTHQDASVRLMASSCFAHLVELVPLHSQRGGDHSKFFTQLANPSEIDNTVLSCNPSIPLRSYQQSGVNWLCFLARNGLHGILADDLGLGKSVQCLTAILNDEFSSDRNSMNLVVCPTTLVYHWQGECQKFFPSSILRAKLILGKPSERSLVWEEIEQYTETDQHLLVVASYDTVRRDVKHFKTMHWNYCILDEGHVLQNRRSQLYLAISQLQARHRLIVTGTPVQNSPTDLWNLFNWLMPGYLGSITSFHQKFTKPIRSISRSELLPDDELRAETALAKLHRQTLPFILRRKKDSVLKDLPPKVIQDLLCDLSNLQNSLYLELTTKQGEIRGKNEVLASLHNLRKLCTHPALLPDGLRPLGSDLTLADSSGKLVALRELLCECGLGEERGECEMMPVPRVQHRILLFCQYKSSIDLVIDLLLRPMLPHVNYVRLDGSVRLADRHDVVQRFNSDASIDMLLLTTHVGGQGLNLTGADTVVFLEHDWNPFRDLQAMDRAHRIGQTRCVNVFRLIAHTSFEEKIMNLQRFKRHVANTVVDADNQRVDSMNTADILDFFTETSKSGDKLQSAASDRDSIISMLDELCDASSDQYTEQFSLENLVMKK